MAHEHEQYGHDAHHGPSTLPAVLTAPAAVAAWRTRLLIVAVIFGVINAFLKPVIKMLGCALYILTLGLFALIVNALLLELTSWLAGKLKLPFHVTGFWPAFWGAIIVGIVSWVLNMFVHDDRAQD